MELKKCPEGHYYDASLHMECPICKQNRAGAGTIPLNDGATMGEFEFDPSDRRERTAPLSSEQAGATAPLSYGSFSERRTEPLEEIRGGGSNRRETADDQQTIAVIHQEIGINPVVGWLVSINGPERGRDYRIYADNNFIGRGEKMDICIRGDETISRSNHAVIAYDTREKMFFFARGEGRSLVRVNGKTVLGTVELQAYDRIEIGKTQLVFIPLCGERFEWTDEHE